MAVRLQKADERTAAAAVVEDARAGRKAVVGQASQQILGGRAGEIARAWGAFVIGGEIDVFVRMNRVAARAAPKREVLVPESADVRTYVRLLAIFERAR